jgi:hypothetical protein
MGRLLRSRWLRVACQWSHRVDAARRIGRTTIWAELRMGDEHQASTYPVHGTPRS